MSPFLLLLMSGLGFALTLSAVPHVVRQDQLVRPEPHADTPIQLNPPSFRWLEDPAAATYMVAWSRTSDFAAAHTVTTRSTFHRPAEPLEPGTWYWRTRVEAPRPGPWSAAERFNLGDDLPRWAVPTWSELLARIPGERPRLFLTAAELPALRKRAARQAKTLALWAEETRAELARPYELASYEERVFGDDDTGGEGVRERRRLVWASKAAAYDLALPLIDAAWLALATAEIDWIEAARSRALLAAGMDPTGFISEENSDFGNARMVAALGLAYDFLYEHLSESERALVRDAIRERARPIFARMGRVGQSLMRPHDWQYAFLDAMIGAVAVQGEVPEAAAWVETGLRAFVAFYPWYGGNDGASAEGMRYYHATNMLSSLNVLDFFRAAFDLRLEEGNPWFRATPYYLIYGYPPGGVMARLGDVIQGAEDDVDNRPAPGGRARLAAARMAELHGNGHAAAYAAILPDDRHGYDVSQFLRWAVPPTVAPVPLETLPPARLFADNGIVSAHSRLTEPEENVRFVFHASPYGAFRHGHADQNSFHIIAYNEDLLIDSGYHTPSGDPHRQRWFVQTKAHNTLLVDGHGQPYGDNRGHARVRHFEQTEDWVYFVGAAEQAYPDAPLERFDRHVLWWRGGETETYVIVDDVIAADGVARRFDWLLHAAQAMEIDEAARTVRVRGERGEATVTFFAPAELTFHQRTGFDDTPAIYWRRGENFPLPNQWHLTVTPPTAPEARFMVVVQVGKRGVVPPVIEARPDGVALPGAIVRFNPALRQLEVISP
jgi:hypothetical protein